MYSGAAWVLKWSWNAEMDSIRKLRIYFDTSVVSHLFADDVPERVKDTLRLWEECIAGKYDVYVSPVLYEEVEECPEPKRSLIYEKLASLEFVELHATESVNKLAAEYIKHGVLTEKSLNDCLHIAYAVVNDCDVVASWNFRHLVKFKTNNGVKIVNAINRYREISIVSPTMLIDDEVEK